MPPGYAPAVTGFGANKLEVGADAYCEGFEKRLEPPG